MSHTVTSDGIYFNVDSYMTNTNSIKTFHLPGNLYDDCFLNAVQKLVDTLEFEDVKIIDSNGVKTTIVYFDDGTFEKSVCQKDDVFSLEYGIGMCISKKMLSDITGKNGTTAYNRLIRKALKTMKDNRKAEEKAKQESAAEELRRKKAAQKRQRRLAKIAERKREEAIEIQAEAYRRAMKDFNN